MGRMNGHVERCVGKQLGDKTATDVPTSIATEPQGREKEEKPTTERYCSIIIITIDKNVHHNYYSFNAIRGSSYLDKTISSICDENPLSRKKLVCSNPQIFAYFFIDLT